MKKFFKDFKAFAMRGNILDMAVGVMIGGAFTAIVTSLVNNILTPLIGVLMGGNHENIYGKLTIKIPVTDILTGETTQQNIMVGAFLESIINFLIMAFCVFLIVKLMARLMPKKAEAPKAEPHLCPFCFKEIDERATRCPYCTAELPAVASVTAQK